ncbi:hypothetical protein NPIL_565021 [Nephila pilipes]|uniref:Uncharacterized protein n=1 Tax=Nephila pilipes TaxID=299642 RepID=A0A8X6U3S2_NEPPI|nr:hypothetical protein NPIL_105861 [Nephila pilipes]GFT71958.1 hypothetical protein NPIL_357401 [Nephila pilipes]GFU56210.1 hypothetical protein NPIL_565021 [Nephila pilipes]
MITLKIHSFNKTVPHRLPRDVRYREIFQGHLVSLEDDIGFPPRVPQITSVSTIPLEDAGNHCYSTGHDSKSCGKLSRETLQSHETFKLCNF